MATKKTRATTTTNGKKTAKKTRGKKGKPLTLAQMHAAIERLETANRLAMAIVLTLAEQTMGAERSEIVRVAIGDLESVDALVQEAHKLMRSS